MNLPALDGIQLLSLLNLATSEIAWVTSRQRPLRDLRGRFSNMAAYEVALAVNKPPLYSTAIKIFTDPPLGSNYD